MLCILNTETEPAWNLAAEEYLLKTVCEDCFMLWRNRSAVIVGRNQNANAEIDSGFVEALQIPLLRRLSGGGAVYHDLGNVNFTRIDATGGHRHLDFQHYTRPILDFLNQLGVPAVFTGRSDLSLDGYKISGNAQYKYRGKVLHHGTLLFAADLDRLARALRVQSWRYRDKAVQSLRQQVTNIGPYFDHPPAAREFMTQLLDFVRKRGNGRQVVFSPADRQAIEALADAKYRRWEWNFGHSPAYRFTKSAPTAAGMLAVDLQVEKGRIRSIRIDGDQAVADMARSLAGQLIGCRHCRQDLVQVLACQLGAPPKSPIVVEELLSAFF